MCFKALPWQPVPCFTGISEYTIDEQARVVKQVDYWDSINLVGGEGGKGDGAETGRPIAFALWVSVCTTVVKMYQRCEAGKSFDPAGAVVLHALAATALELLCWPELIYVCS